MTYTKLMELKQITKHVYYSPHEERRDRPVLGYINGEKYSVIVDAGASAAQANAFSDAFLGSGLTVPEFVVVTHWHWDHTFGMCAVKGKTIAHRNTQAKLVEMRESKDVFSFGDERMCLEHSNAQEIQIVLPDILFETCLVLCLGDIHCHIISIPSPHSDDATAVWIPEEKVLFLGDATSPNYFNGGVYNAKLLHEMICWLENCDFNICILGHSEPLSKTEIMEYLSQI